jgi:type IV secretory pathway VirB10-like protein
MNKITTQISEIKKSMPRHVLWLVMFAAFVVVVILLVMLLSKKSPEQAEAPGEELALAFDPAEIDWLDVPIGEKRTQQIKISANIAAIIQSVKLSEEIQGLSVSTTCTNDKIGELAPEVPCIADLAWTPAADFKRNGVKILIECYPASSEAKMAKIVEIPVALGAKKAPDPAPAEPKPAPKPEPQPAPPPPQPAPPSLGPEPAPAPVVDPVPDPAPVVLPAPDPAPAFDEGIGIESCYEFAFEGYDAYGRQTGWIRPDRGGYLFHLFSDKDCSAPAGEYNPNTGFITDINNPGKKIGSDFEHIGFIASGASVPDLSANEPLRAQQSSGGGSSAGGGSQLLSKMEGLDFKSSAVSNFVPSSAKSDAFTSSEPYDRTFVLRQYKPIPATIVNEIRADWKLNAQSMLPVQATVDRHVYSDNGRTIIIPTGTLMLGYVFGDMPGPYKAIGRMEIKWYRFVRPDGVEFSFGEDDPPFAGDNQGRVGVPGYGSTDYMEQFIMPMITAIVPAAVNMIAPISDKFVNQIDLDNNTVTQSGQVRSSEMAKNEIITTWNKIAQKLMVDMLDNTVPPFSIAAGTRITVYSPKDLILNFCDKVGGLRGDDCGLTPYEYIPYKKKDMIFVNQSDPSWTGQVRSFDIQQYCDKDGNVKASTENITKAGYDYRTILAFCKSTQYQAINNVKQEAVFQNQQKVMQDKKYEVAPGGYNEATKTTSVVSGNQSYNEQVLGLQYNDDGSIKNPFQKETPPAPEAAAGLTCEDGTPPDTNGCCTGEVYTDMGAQGFNCCPSAGGDCFPPLV